MFDQAGRFIYFFSFLEIFSSNVIETNITDNYIDTIESQELKLYLEKIYSIIENFIKKKKSTYGYKEKRTSMKEKNFIVK